MSEARDALPGDPLLDDAAFRRATGVRRATFAEMLALLTTAEQKRRRRGGRKPKLSVADRLLMALMYLREYRTYFHIAQTYRVSEPTCYRTCRWVEETLVRSRAFRLPGRKALLDSGTVFEVVAIDATETSVERPQKASGGSTPERRSATP